MKIRIGNRNYGFTVIELMIVVMIVAILAALAYPSYIQYVRKSKRGDAQQLLLNWSINQEIFRSSNTTYADLDNLPPPTADENYGYGFADGANPTATTYILQATADGDQVNDVARNGTECTELTLDQNGLKSPAECWE